MTSNTCEYYIFPKLNGCASNQALRNNATYTTIQGKYKRKWREPTICFTPQTYVKIHQQQEKQH
jgi:hypothetical protein